MVWDWFRKHDMTGQLLAERQNKEVSALSSTSKSQWDQISTGYLLACIMSVLIGGLFYLNGLLFKGHVMKWLDPLILFWIQVAYIIPLSTYLYLRGTSVRLRVE